MFCPGLNSKRVHWLLPVSMVSFLFSFGACSSSGPDGNTLPSAGTAGQAAAGEGTGGSGGGGSSSGGSAAGSGNILTVADPGAAGAGNFDVGDACVAEEANTEPAPAFVELLVDTSLSMGQTVDGDNDPGEPSKWELTRDVLVEAVAQMSAETAVGLAFYPDVGVGAAACFDEEQDVELALLTEADSEQREKLNTAFAEQEPNGSTPTHDAYVYSLGQFDEVDATAGRFVVLITDGEPTFALGCEGTGLPGNAVETGPLIEEATKALEDNTKTFVIGSPGSENARESLSRMAEAGGTGTPGCNHDGPNYCHFDMTQQSDFAGALAGALSDISGLTTSCAYPVPSPPDGSQLDPTKVNVVFTASSGDVETILPAASEDCESGWEYTEDNSQVVLCPATCEEIQAQPGQLALAFGCETERDAPL